MLASPESPFSSGLTGTGGSLYVYIEPDGKPVCSMCKGVAMQSVNELRMIEDYDWKGDDLDWLFNLDTEEAPVTVHHTPDGARAELERVQNQWRWEDLGWTEDTPLETPQEPVQADPE
jgi:hypothetical protein